MREIDWKIFEIDWKIFGIDWKIFGRGCGRATALML